MLTAGEAAQQLMSLAKQHFPDSALAKCDAWHEPVTNLRDTKAANVLAELRNRDYDIDELEPYISKMQEFLKKSKTLDQIKESLGKGNIYRKTKQETLPPISLSKAMAKHITWTTDHEHRLLIFLCAFPDHFMPLPNDSFIAKSQSKAPTENCINQELAQEAILKHGTPVRLLYLLYEKLGLRVVIYQGATCRFVRTPSDWNTRPAIKKDTIVLNVWSGHVFTYEKQVDKAQFKPKTIKHYDKLLVTLRGTADKYEFGNMQPFSWDDLLVAIQENKQGTLFWTTESLDYEFFEGLDAHKISFIPNWKTDESCKSIYIPLGRRRNGIHVRKFPK